MRASFTQVENPLGVLKAADHELNFVKIIRKALQNEEMDVALTTPITRKRSNYS